MKTVKITLDELAPAYDNDSAFFWNGRDTIRARPDGSNLPRGSWQKINTTADIYGMFFFREDVTVDNEDETMEFEVEQ